MDRNCLNNGVCFLPGALWHGDVTCMTVSHCRSFLATGTRQGYVVLWKIRRRSCSSIPFPVSFRRFKEHYERENGVTLDPYYMLISSNNPIAIPVKQVAFASGMNPAYSLKGDFDSSTSRFGGAHKAEDVLVSLHKDNSIAIWSVPDCRCLHKVKGPPFAIKRMCILPDDRFMALVGRRKINVIDIWRLKLIGMLELDGTCHFDMNIYSTRPQTLTRSSCRDDLSLENANVNTFSITPTSSRNRNLYTKPQRILRATCGPVPFSQRFHGKDAVPNSEDDINCESDSTCRQDYGCPYLLSVLLDNHEMVLWDLTAPILTYKGKYGALGYPVNVVTRWDQQYQDGIGYHKRAVSDFRNSYNLGVKRPSRLSLIIGGDDAGNDAKDACTDFPMFREWIPELENTGGDVCVVDRYVFVILGIRILVWFYDFEGLLTRTAELLSIGDAGISYDDPWHGFQCVRLSEERTLLVGWTVSGRVSIFAVPKAKASVKQFKLLEVHNYPSFRATTRFKGDISVYIPKGYAADEKLERQEGFGDLVNLYLLRHTMQGQVIVGRRHRKSWSSVCTNISASMAECRMGDDVSSTCLFYKDGAVHRVDVFCTGSTRLVNLCTGSECTLRPFTDIGHCVRFLTRGCRMKPLVFPGSKVMEWLDMIQFDEPPLSLPAVGRSLVHCLGSSYLVICTGRSQLLVYSLALLNLVMVISNMHCAPIKAMYSAYTVYFSGSKVNDASFTEMEDVLATVDSSGGIVLMQLSLVSDDLDNDISSFGQIGEGLIYSDTSDSDEPGPFTSWNTCVDHYLSASVFRRGVYRMERSTLLRNRDIERVVVNLSKDMLFVLTHDFILVWRLNTGRFLRALPYLNTYRQAVYLSSESPSGEEQKFRHISSLADTISSLLMTDWQTSSTSVAENLYQTYLDEITPHCLLSVCMFQEKCFKKRISPSLHMSYVRLHFTSSSWCKGTVEVGGLRPAVSGSRRNMPALRLSKRKLQVLRCSRSCPKMSRWRYTSCDKYSDSNMSYNTATSTNPGLISHMSPVLIFPMKEVLSNLDGTGGSLFPKVAGHGAACYFGVPPGTISIPLRHRPSVSKRCTFIKKRVTQGLACWRDDRCRYDLGGSIRRSSTFSGSFEYRRNSQKSSKIRNYGGSRYFSTCMLLRQLVLDHHATSPGTFLWQCPVDVWLLGHLILTCQTSEILAQLSNALVSALGFITHKELCSHVCRALALLRCRDIPPNDPRLTFPEVVVCKCHCTTFSFGQRCGFCLHASRGLDVAYVWHGHSIKPWEMDISLLLLVSIAMDTKLSEMCNFVIVGPNRYTFGAYVARLIVREMVTPDNDDWHEDLEYPPAQRAFDPKTYYVEMFARGFGTVWTLQTMNIYSVLPSSFSRSRIHMLAKSFYESPKGSRSSAAKFVINVMALYRASKSEHWLQILTCCFPMDPALIMQIMRWVVQEPRLDKWYTEQAIQLLLEFATLFRDLAIQYLPDMVVIIVRCLDPSNATMRLLMLKPATSALFHLVKNFPMVSFYQNTQRFAVGSTSGHVVIYDLRTATRCRILGGDFKNVSSIAFSATGEYIAAYYKDEPCLVVWNCSSSGFLGSLLHSARKEQKVVRLKTIESNPLDGPVVSFSVFIKQLISTLVHCG
ncbi:hypothetical protein X943_002197 [Babesia divergens]|uniref:Uncharacterized protein n=1 Tax=Babesia divergens TaxID=32595 RepID=A0AAD9LJ34_BABDI|nr:hypothetical protein X943_002197 [Babesia divergens]